jgi:hypothetical protein
VALNHKLGLCVLAGQYEWELLLSVLGQNSRQPDGRRCEVSKDQVSHCFGNSSPISGLPVTRPRSVVLVSLQS